MEWWNGFCHYDRVYMSKVFTFTPDIDTVIYADEIIRGGKRKPGLSRPGGEGWQNDRIAK